jgi:hypothetical protein
VPVLELKRLVRLAPQQLVPQQQALVQKPE